MSHKHEKLGVRKFADLSLVYRALYASQEEDDDESLNVFIGNEDCWNNISNLDDSSEGENGEKSKDLLQYINESVIGRHENFVGPFGSRKIVYCDFIASGKPLSFLEDYIRANVLPSYGNTHTTTTITSLQTTLFRHESRDIIRNAVNASEYDAVIFCGNGCTAAVHKLINGLMLTEPPIVFVGPYEHHSNLLPWRELPGAKVVRIKESESGLVDLDDLENRLKEGQSLKRQMIGCFAAASNITGILAQDEAITILLRKYDALSFWDYATAAPYTKLDMNPERPFCPSGSAHKDAMYFSMHKFIGGVQTPGILVVKKKVILNPVPNGGGGGTVFFVTRDDHRYLQDIELREEGGTPAIVESIRAGMVMQLKEQVTPERIMSREEELTKLAFNRWKDVPGLILLGSTSVPRLPVFSFMIQHTSGFYLHHNFVCALLNDVFGIQARGGCACAGPYAQDLLGIDEQLAQEYESVLLEDSRLDRVHLRRKGEYSCNEVLRPGFTRLNLAYFASEEEVEFVLSAVELVARFGWLFLPYYRLNPETGEWHHMSQLTFKNRKWLGSIDYSKGFMRIRQTTKVKPPPSPDFEACLKEAQELFENISTEITDKSLPDQSMVFSDSAARLRWFLLPSEAVDFLKLSETSSLQARKPPFAPRVYDKITVWSNILPQCSMIPFVEKTIACSNLKSSETTNHHLESPEDSFQSVERPVQNAESTVSTSTVSTSSDSALDSSRNTDTLPSPDLENAIWNELQVDICDESCSSEENDDQETSVSLRSINSQVQWATPPKPILKAALEAWLRFPMAQNGDRVLVCLSGGKDSLSLLHVLRYLQQRSSQRGVAFTLGAVTVDPASASYDPRPLIPYIESLGIPYFYERQCIMGQALESEGNVSSICSFCSRLKRGRIYAAARRENYNVIALGQHLDDLAESFLMSAFHNGRLRTMKACYSNQKEDLKVIRPLVYAREKDLRDFATSAGLPVIAENCPACFEAPKERYRIKQLLAHQELLYPRLFFNLKSTMLPLIQISEPGVEKQLYGKASNLKKLGHARSRKDSEDEF